MQMSKYYGALVICLSGMMMVTSQDKADLVVFSYNRPMQLYALLESVQRHVTGLGETYVIYRAGNPTYHAAYDQVQHDFPWAHFVAQGANPHQNFKPLMLQCAFESPNPYILFGVDDIIVKDAIDVAECIKILEETHAYGFYLRLGKNLTHCYTMSCVQRQPQFHEVYDGILAWSLGDGSADWNYPNTVDMTLYRKCDIEQQLRKLSYTEPNTLEGAWASQGHAALHCAALCCALSKIVNIPLNRVQDVYNNKHMNSDVGELLALFNKGLKIDIDALYKIHNTMAHMPYKLRLIERKRSISKEG